MLVVAACGGADESSSTPTDAPPAESNVDGALDDLTIFGSLVDAVSAPVTVPFDASAGRADLGGGVGIEAPAGAFPDTTSVEFRTAELAFDRVVDGQPNGTIYVLSTADDVDPAERCGRTDRGRAQPGCRDGLRWSQRGGPQPDVGDHHRRDHPS